MLLADGLGFRYGLRKHSSWTTWNWACTSRLHDEKNVPYKATVSQRVSFSIPTDEILSSNNYPRIFKTFLVMDLYSFQYQDASVGERDSKLHSRLVIDAKTAALNPVLQENFTLRPHDEDNRHNHVGRLRTTLYNQCFFFNL